MTTATAQTTTYKGKTYRLLWSGSTKFGPRAKLGFMDGTKEFWVNAGEVGGSTSSSARSAPSRSRGTRTGCSCGSVNEYTKASDCFTCQHDA